ncbi:MAG: bifunctional methylenetetrahydrofolate dehydrogenase/methenyltetrahydrofolate cyclohydrolase FolD [Candidatus Latescibacteria bacterium]|nr:bifunctional methylenetetrahydrofolate dehydrogenase/methenyltetrahydrofolate cyclohydrolase FolD [bacterium]MBD3423696.1 bifunctional methylenetetrahydrofolate dehydrogenase/methenyltetrahydrofolate cyclohydrolase FolD [Candidatus Latescibacterota bacterium]
MRDERIIDGKATAKSIVEEIGEEAEKFSRGKRAPSLRVIILGEDPASRVYVRNKIKTAKKCNIESELLELPDDLEEGELFDIIEDFNSDSGIDGFMVQLPLPAHINENEVIRRISPQKDVDGIHPFNLGMMVEGNPQFIPCTPLGITELLKRYRVRTEGKKAVIIGRSIIVGKPMALILSSKLEQGNATVTVCHSRTPDIEKETREADILVSAVGKPEFITGDMVKEDAVVIDVGVNRVEDTSRKKGYRLAGDVDFQSVLPRVSLITPVPGGVGPMTVAMLMKNTLKAAKMASGS